jgi:hypothetical protein
MTDTTTRPGAEAFAAAEEATRRTREFGAQATRAGQAFGQLALDNYERGVATFVEFEQKAAEATPVGWIKTAVSAHATLVQDVNAAYLKAARAALD